MNKQKKKVMLGCWGIGGSLSRSPSSVGRIVLERGPFEGESIPSAAAHGITTILHDWHLPPLARQTDDGIDLMPFILYDTVTIDKLAFECMLGAKPSLAYWRPKQENVAILESLASDRYIILEDYLGRLNTPEVAELIDELTILDLSDSNIIRPTIESLELWIQFYKDLFDITDVGLSHYHRAIAALEMKGEKRAPALPYVYECISDINRILILAQELEQPIYEWEDYCRYYRYKFLRVAKQLPNRPQGRTLAQLFDVFIPDFSIRSYNELLEIRHDHRLSAVRKLVDILGDAPISKDLVIQANEDVLRVKTRLETFSKYVGYAGYPLSVVLPSPLGTALQNITNAIARQWLEKEVQWQMFFVERVLKYRRPEIQDTLRKDMQL